jgi:LCP family protein required for cell wall assembly
MPGWGQLATHHTGIGKTLVFFTGLVLIAALTVFLFVEPIEIAVWLADPDVILGIVILNIVFLAIRLFSTEHAWWAGGGHRWFVAVFLAFVVALPHVAVGWVGLETRDTMIRLFPETPAAVAAPVTGTSTSTSTSTTTSTIAPVELDPFVSAPGQYEDDRIDATTTEGWAPFGEDRLNILLLGGDAGPGRLGLRTDTMIVASVDPVSGESALFGVPRNFSGVRFTDGSLVPVRRLNHVYGWGTRHPEVFGGIDPGASAVVDAIQHITGLEIDRYVLVDLTGFADMIDVLGGVQLNVAAPVDGPVYDPVTGGYEMVRIEAGLQQLDGGHALAYARARYGSSDYARMARQRCILSSLAGQADPLELFTRLPEVLGVVEENLSTDIPAETLPDLVRLLLSIRSQEIRVIGFDDDWGVRRTPDGHVIPDVDRIRQTVQLTLEDPVAAASFGAVTAADACG